MTTFAITAAYGKDAAGRRDLVMTCPAASGGFVTFTIHGLRPRTAFRMAALATAIQRMRIEASK